MSICSALVVDSEYVDGMFRRVCGRKRRHDIGKVLSYFVDQDRFLLWARWYVKEPLNEIASFRIRRHAYYDKLRSHGVRVVVCHSKPISRVKDQHEQNVCDFEISEGIRLAALAAPIVIVATGDGHLSSAIRNAHEQAGRRVEVFCERSSLSSTIEADQLHFLEDIIESGHDLTRAVRRQARPSVNGNGSRSRHSR